jgi:hypothetical protein
MVLNNVAKLQTPRSKLGLADIPMSSENSDGKKLLPKQLFDIGDKESERSCESEPTESYYKSPIKLYLSEKKGELKIAEIELHTAQEHFNKLRTMLNAPIATVTSLESGTGKQYQCGMWHLNQGHSKTRCPNGKCDSADQCKDINTLLILLSLKRACTFTK